MTIIMSEEVAARLGPETAALLGSGELLPTPEYQCLGCRRRGDVRHDDSAVVVLVTDVSTTVAWVHSACGASEVFHHDQLEARYGRPDDPEPGSRCQVPDSTGITLVECAGTVYPALIITAGHNLRRILGPGRMVDDAVERMRGFGFAAVDLTGHHAPVALTRWMVRVTNRRLTEITMPGGAWWRTRGETDELTPEWLAAARATRRVLLMITATAMPEGDLALLRAVMTSAVYDGRMVAALVSVRGV